MKYGNDDELNDSQEKALEEDEEEDEEESEEESDEEEEEEKEGVSDEVRRQRWFSDPMFASLNSSSKKDDDDDDDDIIQAMKNKRASVKRERPLAERLQAYSIYIEE